MATIASRAASRLKTLAFSLSSRTCLHRNSNVAVRQCSSQVSNQKLELTDPTKDPEYEKALKRFKDISDPDKNYYFHGYNPYDREDDTFWHHHTMFLNITGVFIIGGFIIAYLPDHKLVHWRQREAYLELHRRETNGLPLVDPDLVPREKMMAMLPSDEELGNTEIII